jgi:serine/threonine protein phosphatase 1
VCRTYLAALKRKSIIAEVREFVIGDIHGGLRALEDVISQVSPEASDHFIFLGDYVDGWSQASETVEYLIEFAGNNRALFLRGNHDDLLLSWLKDGLENPLWLNSGGAISKKSYEGIGMKTRTRHIEFLDQLKDYHLDEQSRLFLHAGFTNLRGVQHEYFSKNFYWDRTLWETALSLDPRLSPTDAHYPSRLRHYAEIFIGHTPVTRIGKELPHCAANVWNLDTGAAFKGRLSVMETRTKSVWQSKPLPEYYPKELGRNGEG